MKDTTNSRASPCSSSVLRALGSSFFPFFYFWRMGWVGGSYIAEPFEVTEYLNAIGSNTPLPKSFFFVCKYICVRVFFFFFSKKINRNPKKFAALFLRRYGSYEIFSIQNFFQCFQWSVYFLFFFFNSFTLFFIIIGPFFLSKKNVPMYPAEG